MRERWNGPMSEHKEPEHPNHEISWAGRLDGGISNPNVWRGKISANLNVIKRRFDLLDRDSARDKLEGFKQRVEHSYVAANPEAVVRCIDGRGEGDTVPDRSNLAPQVPGGTAVTSFAYRLSKGLTTEATIESDTEEYRRLLEELDLPYIPGGHEDEHNADHPENTGCGAIDKMLDILKIMAQYDVDDQGSRRYGVYDYAKAISAAYMDEASFERIFQDIQIKLQALNGPHFNDRYFQKEEATGSHRFRSGILEKVKEGGRQRGRKTVEKLAGEHNEVFLLVNLVADETFDRDGFAAETGGKAQAFNYDVWVIDQRTKGVLPDDAEKQRTMLLTNIMYAVGTAMALTDGSLEVGIRQ